MMDLETIHNVSQEQAAIAANENKIPLIITKEDIDYENVRGIPSLGTYLPDDWERVSLETWPDRGIYMSDNEGFGALFVDSSGFTEAGEAALSLEEFIKALVPDLGYAIVEEGQFQVKVGVFKYEG
tara:strand:- start:5 stop:382 length:378 start_codon:yes stop_codon:yes gene_type:complete